WIRSISSAPNCFSIARACWLTADCVTPLRRAAFEKLFVSTRSAKILKLSICMLRVFRGIYYGFLSIQPKPRAAVDRRRMDYPSFAENLSRARARVAAACEAAGRDPAEVRILPVTKNHPAEAALL